MDDATVDTAQVDTALAGLRDVLGADGYELRWTVEDGTRLSVEVLAGPDACADCLVPAEIMQAIMTDALASTPYTVGRIALPTEK